MRPSKRFMTTALTTLTPAPLMTRAITRLFTPILTAVILVALAFAAGCAGQPTVADTEGSNAQASSQQPASQEAPRQPATPEGSDIIILLDDVTETANFYPTTVGGVALEVMAIRAPDGTVRTAFNTCQSCFTSGRGYYVQEGSELVCQNCGNRFAANHVEIESGGCNPVPIFEGDKVTSDTAITIPASYLKEAQSLFENWKR
jgi:hypothetical protein